MDFQSHRKTLELFENTSGLVTLNKICFAAFIFFEENENLKSHFYLQLESNW